MNFYLTAIFLGLGLSSLGFGIFISMRIFRIPDITTDGSFTLGAAITSFCISNQFPIAITLILSFFSGFLAGCITGAIHTRLKVNALLAGIIVMTALYSVNLGIMGKPNIPLINVSSIFTIGGLFVDPLYQNLFVFILFIFLLWLLLSYLLQTDFGLAMRATGENENMVRAEGVNTTRMKIFGLGLANGLVSLSGFLICQYQGFTDINMGIGIVILGLGSVMIGESILDFLGIHHIAARLAGIIGGSILFRLILALALDSGLNSNLLKLVTAVLVLLFVGMPELLKNRRKNN
jgi:putative ABC transport system permease protein